MQQFRTVLKIIGINPYVVVPDPILKALFASNGKDKSPVPVKGTVNGIPYQQTLVKYKGLWRLYINTKMLKNSPERIGEVLELTIGHDTSDRSVKPHPQLIAALEQSPDAYKKYQEISPSLRKEINRYIARLKSESSIERNVNRAVNFLTGKSSFIGRDKIK